MLNPCAYASLFNNLGTSIRLFRAIPHSCLNNADAYDQVRACPDCDHGYLYIEEALPPEAKLGIDVVRYSMHHPQFGWVVAGDLMATALPDKVWIGAYDKVVILGWEREARDACTRGTTDKLLFPYVSRIEWVREDATVYAPGTDWSTTIDAAGFSTIVWAAGRGPAADAYYSVGYRYSPVFWCAQEEESLARPTGGSNSSLPRSVKLVAQRPTRG